MERVRAPWRVVGVLGLLVLVGSCGQSAPSAAPASAPAPTPTAASTAPPKATTAPKPAGIVERFDAWLAARPHELAGPLSGRSATGERERTLTGAAALNGADWGQHLEIHQSGQVASWDRIYQAGTAYESSNGGPWFEARFGGSEGVLSGALALAGRGVAEDGTVDREGEHLVRLVPSEGEWLRPAQLGLDLDFPSLTGTTAFFVRDDGSLAGLVVDLSWEMLERSDLVDAYLTLEAWFRPDGRAVVLPPEPVWSRFASPLFGYSIGYPPGWEASRATSESESDLFRLSASRYAAVTRDRLPDDLLDDVDGYLEAFVDAEEGATGVVPESQEPVAAAYHLPGRRLTYHRTVDGVDTYTVHTLFLLGGSGYQISMWWPPADEETANQLHELQVGTFELTE